MSSISPRTAAATTAAIVATMAGMSVSSIAQAQGWRSDLQGTEGPGLRAGNVEFHPGVGVEAGYDSNVFFTDDPDNQVRSGLLRVTPHLDISTIGSERAAQGEDQGRIEERNVEFRAGLAASYYHFFADTARSNVGADATAKLTLFKPKPFYLSIYNNYKRTIQPFAEEGAIGDNFDRNMNESGLTLNYHSRGDILTAALGYSAHIDMFAGESFSQNNTLRHTVDGRVDWKFLPSTAAFYEMQVGYRDFLNDPLSGPALNANSTTVRTRVGVTSVFTPKVSALAAIGYAGNFVDSDELSEFDSVIAEASVQWTPTDTLRFELGYDRDFTSAYVGNFYSRDRGFLRGGLTIAQRWSVGAEAWVGYLQYGRVVSSNGTPLGAGGDDSRSDVMVSASTFSEYRFLKWLAANVTFSYLGNYTDFEFATPTPIVDPAGFNKFQIWGGVRASY